MDISVVKGGLSALVLVVLLALPGPLGAQAGPDPSPGKRVTAAGGVVLKGSRIAEENRLHLGGWAGLVIGERLAVGGGGFSLLESVELAGSEAGTGFDLGMGYAGVMVKYWQPLGPRISGEVGTLLGAGHAEVDARLVGTEVGTDNFIVDEPELSVFISVLQNLRLGVSAGYRMVWGVEDLPRTSADDLRSITGAISIRLGGI